jgi:hypothetical protein
VNEGNTKAGLLLEGEGSEAGRSAYAKWRIFVCQVATIAGVGPGQSE